MTPDERFAKAPRNDPARPRRVRCLNPFRWIEINDGGMVTPCCSPWFLGSLGNINDRTLEEIWNGEAFREARRAMYEGGDWRKFCNPRTCPQIFNDTWVDVDFIEPDDRDIVPITAEVLEDVREGRTEMRAGPVQIGLSCDPRCNLDCIMCSARDNPHRDGKTLRRAIEGIDHYLPDVRRIKMMGDGEVFAIAEARRFMTEFDSRANPRTSFLIHTNGVLLTPQMWEKLEGTRIDWLVVSIDAATRETYERIRRGGKWDVLMSNLEHMAQLFKAGRIGQFHINMCVMKSNHHEMVQFAEMGLRLGVTSVYFTPILGDYRGEQIFERREIGALRRVAEQMRDPVMSQPGVDVNALGLWRDWKPTARDYARSFKRGMKRLLDRSLV